MLRRNRKEKNTSLLRHENNTEIIERRSGK
jgi:hypothetical protein